MKQKWLAILLCLIAMVSIFPVNAFAAKNIDTNKDVSLTIRYEHDSKGIEGAKFSLYKIATVDAYGKYKLTDEFALYNVSVEGLNQKGMEELAETLAGYTRRDIHSSVDSGKTDADGLLRFPTGGKTLKPGLYLVVGEKLTSDGYIYTAQPSVVALPMAEEQNTWNYDLTIQCKHERDREQTVSRKVLKIWDDKGFEAARPSEVIVQLLKNNDVYDTVSLNQINNWQYNWSNLDNRYTWSIVEKEVKDYTVSVELNSDTFTVTNTYVVPAISDNIPVTKKLTGDIPANKETFTFVMMANGDGYPMPDGSAYGMKEVSVLGAGSTKFGKMTFTAPGTYTYTISEKNNGELGYKYDTGVYTLIFTVTQKDGNLNVQRSLKKSDGTSPSAVVFTNSYKTPGNKIPLTGLLWWPVSLFAIAGLILILIGLIRRKLSKNES